MPSDLVDAIGRNIDAFAYIALVLVLMVTAIHADKRYTQERDRNTRLERRIQSLVLVVRFQQTLVDAKMPEPQSIEIDEPLDLSVDAMISKMGYCLSCHRLKAPSHFATTQHLRLEDNLVTPDKEGH